MAGELVISSVNQYVPILAKRREERHHGCHLANPFHQIITVVS
jgi:hypothetical protein